jgi:hypothetical protein
MNKIKQVNLQQYDEEFEIPVSYDNKELSFHARLRVYGYSFKIEVEIAGIKVMFERDEERNCRALIPLKI